MDFIGTWVFHSIGVGDEEKGFVYLNGEEYLASDMPYIDADDKEAYEDEMKERRLLINSKLKICEDGNWYYLLPLPEGARQEEVDAAVAAGDIKFMDGMLTDEPHRWELRNGELWYDTGIEGEIYGEPTDGFAKAMDDNGFINYMNFRFVKE